MDIYTEEPGAIPIQDALNIALKITTAIPIKYRHKEPKTLFSAKPKFIRRQASYTQEKQQLH